MFVNSVELPCKCNILSCGCNIDFGANFNHHKIFKATGNFRVELFAWPCARQNYSRRNYPRRNFPRRNFPQV